MSEIIYASFKNKLIIKKTNDISVIIAINDIYFVEKFDKNNIKIHYKGGVVIARMSLTYFNKMIDNDMFVRTHKSFIVNINEVSEIHDFFQNYLLKFHGYRETALITKDSFRELKNTITTI